MEVNANVCNNGTTEQFDEQSVVAIVDSSYKVGGDFSSFNQVDREQRIIDTDEDNTTGHGTVVTKILSTIATNPKFQFYQIIDEYGEYDDGDLLTAIVRATDYGADVINLSVGSPHVSDDDKLCDHSGAQCSLDKAVKYAVDNGTIVVSAVGNAPTYDTICCPALSESSIAVGGCLVKCSASLGKDQTPIGVQAGSGKPPKAMWLSSKSEEGISDVLCSGMGCYPGGSCEENQYIVKWDGNPRFVGDTPDTIAPVNYPQKMENGVGVMRAGTSFATPVISGGLANVVEVLRQNGVSVNPDEIRKYIRLTGEEIEDSPATLFDAIGLATELLGEHDLPPVRVESNSGSNSLR